MRDAPENAAPVEPRSESRVPPQRHHSTPVVPYVAMWSREVVRPPKVIERFGGGISYSGEVREDRDERGILWDRAKTIPGQGAPQFARIHTRRQRHAMRELLCQVCGNPADKTGNGVLWLFSDSVRNCPGWPDNFLATEPPTCLRCARWSISACPMLRRGHVALRVREWREHGVHGTVYRWGNPSPRPIPTGDSVVEFDHPVISRTVAAKLVRELGGCTVVEL